MQHQANYTFAGSTAELSEMPAFSTQELVALCEHLGGCSRKSSGLDRVWSLVERVHGFAAARLVTTCAVLAFLVWIVLPPV